jgi:hypothetical protein
MTGARKTTKASLLLPFPGARFLIAGKGLPLSLFVSRGVRSTPDFPNTILIPPTSSGELRHSSLKELDFMVSLRVSLQRRVHFVLEGIVIANPAFFAG